MPVPSSPPRLALSVRQPWAELILQGKLHEGETVKISANKDGVIINGQAVKQAA